MKRTICGLMVSFVILWFAGAGSAAGIPGATDRTLGATLLVPFLKWASIEQHILTIRCWFCGRRGRTVTKSIITYGILTVTL